MLLEVKQDYPDNWEQKDTNKNAASDLVADLLKKETLGRLPRRRAKRPE
jgi:hypothetical protein